MNTILQTQTYENIQYLHSYLSIKNKILGIKALVLEDLVHVSELLYTQIRHSIEYPNINTCSHTNIHINADSYANIHTITQERTNIYTHNVLLLNCPSSTFANNRRARDQTAEILIHIKRIHDNYINSEIHAKSNTSIDSNVIYKTQIISDSSTFLDANIHIPLSINVCLDILPHCVRLCRENRSAQHDKNRKERTDTTKNKFELAFPLPTFFLKKYQSIYIIDDVVTTGSSLNEIKNVLLTKTKFKGTVTLLAIAH